MSFNTVGRNVLIGAISSVIALNLGLAMGILSGRDGFLGMVSAGLIAIITSYFGGAKVSGSGPTAPMSALAAVILLKASQSIEIGELTPDQFLNLILFIAAILLIGMSFFKVGRFISYIPGVVVSGFMSGVGLMVWNLQYHKMFGAESIEGPLMINILIALGTFIIALFFPPIFKKLAPKIAPFVPGTLVSLVAMTFVTHAFSFSIEFLHLTTGEEQLGGWLKQLPSHWPQNFTLGSLLTAFPFSFELAVLCYLDTMLTLVIIEKMKKEKANRDVELKAQGLAMGAIGLIGGVPGAQSTVPSVLLVKEGADSKWAGVSMGFFALLGVFFLAPLVNFIPFAVIVGILLKVGWNVFDFAPFIAFLRKDNDFKITGILFVALTALLAVFVDIIFAVFFVTIIYHALNKTVLRQYPIKDWHTC